MLTMIVLSSLLTASTATFGYQHHPYHHHYNGYNGGMDHRLGGSGHHHVGTGPVLSSHATSSSSVDALPSKPSYGVITKSTGTSVSSAVAPVGPKTIVTPLINSDSSKTVSYAPVGKTVVPMVKTIVTPIVATKTIVTPVVTGFITPVVTKTVLVPVSGYVTHSVPVISYGLPHAYEAGLVYGHEYGYDHSYAYGQGQGHVYIHGRR